MQRDLHKLPTSGRPLSQKHGVESIYNTRKPMYERFADIVADNNGTVEETVAQILQKLHLQPANTDI